MRQKRTLKELTLKDNFMFGAVMCDERNCRRFLEMVLGFQIERVEVSKEKSIVYHPEYKGVRLDVFAKDENNTHYNVEMQAVKDEALSRRARYYHSQIDMELIKFLDYVRADLEESTKDFGDEFVKSLQDSVASIKVSREMGERFMLFEELLKDERKEGKAEGRAECIIELLEELSVVQEELRNKILEEQNILVLKRWFKLAAKAESIEQFISEM